MDRDTLIQRLSDLLRPRQDIACAWLYGSQARGDARAGSDVDVAVLFEQTPAPTLAGASLAFDLAADLQQALHLPVEVIVANTAPVDLMHRVLRDGVLVAEKNPSHRVRFEVATRNEWFDLKPILDEYRRTGRFADG